MLGFWLVLWPLFRNQEVSSSNQGFRIWRWREVTVTVSALEDSVCPAMPDVGHSGGLV